MKKFTSLAQATPIQQIVLNVIPVHELMKFVSKLNLLPDGENCLESDLQLVHDHNSPYFCAAVCITFMPQANHFVV